MNNSFLLKKRGQNEWIIQPVTCLYYLYIYVLKDSRFWIQDKVQDNFTLFLIDNPFSELLILGTSRIISLRAVTPSVLLL